MYYLRLLLIACFCSSLQAQRSFLAGRVVDEENHGLAGVTVRALDLGESTTGLNGEFNISLPSEITPGAVIAVYVLPRTWVLKDFPDGYVTIRRDDMPRLTLRLARRGLLSLLTDARIRRLLEQTVTHSPQAASTPQPGFDTLILQKASSLGLTPVEIRRAVDDWVKHRAGSNAHDRGLAAFYKRNFALAITEWETSVTLRESDLAETYTLLCYTELLQKNYSRAGDWIHKALSLEPTDFTVLLGMAYVCALLPDQDEQESREKTSVGCHNEPVEYFDDALSQLRLTKPRSYASEAVLLVLRPFLHSFSTDTGDESNLEFESLVRQLRALAEEARDAEPRAGNRPRHAGYSTAGERGLL